MKKIITIFSVLILLSNFSYSQHFTPIWTGYPYQPMSIVVQNATIDAVTMEAGDEVAVFDIGDGGSLICVGSVVLTGGTIIVTASADEPGSGIEGFTAGNDIVFKMWDNSESKEITLNYPVFNDEYPFEIVYATFGTASVTSLPGYSDVETTASTLSTCSGSVVVPITVEDVHLITEFALSLSYGTTNLTYTGYQNVNTELSSGSLSVSESSGDIDITWSSTTTANISSGTLLELLFTAPVLYSEATENILWDAGNSFYINSYSDNLETSFTNGIVTINPIPVAAGTITGTTSVCQGTTNVSYEVPVITNASSYVWALVPTTAGTILGDEESITVDYSDSYSGQVTLSVYGSNSCGVGTSSSTTITVIGNSTVNAGIDDTSCEDTPYTLSGTASNQQSVLWSTSGDGAFNDATSITSSYTPGSSDISAGNVTLTLTAYAVSPCSSNAVDDMTLTLLASPVANANSDATICEGTTYTLSGSASDQQSVLWSTSGDGTFDDATSLTAIYTPGSNDILSGSAILTLTAYAISPCSNAATDELTLTIQGAATANANSDASVCESSSYILSGSATNQSSVLWSNSGDGVFDDATSLTAVYTLGSSDLSTGSVTLTLTSYSVSPCSSNASDDMTLTIINSPTADANIDATICEGSSYTLSGLATNQQSILWSTSGDGTFDDASSLSAIYTSGSNDISSGSATLTLTAYAILPCAIDATDELILTIQGAATANANTDATICEGSTYILSGLATNQTSVLWTTSGDGTFDDASLASAVYTPGSGDITGGSVTMTLTAYAVSPCASNATDDMILTIQDSPVTDANSDATVCEGSDYTLAGTASNQQSVLWSTGGDGTFDDATLLTATYTPGSSDITSGSVVLTITAYTIAPCGIDAMDDITLTIQGLPVAIAGANNTICEGSTHTLSGTAFNQQSVLWTTSGDGTFDDLSSLTATYTPGSADITNGSATLSLTAYSISPCSTSDSDDMILMIQPESTANAGDDASTCDGSGYTLSGTASNQQTILWTTAGDGTFDDTSLLTATYSPGTNDIASGTVVLTLTANSISPCSNNSTDDMTLTIQESPTASANVDDTICESSTYTLSGSASNQQSILWSTAGDGTFDDATSLSAIYTPGSNDISLGSVTLTLTAYAISPCNNSATDELILTIQGAATANANTDDIVCEGSTYTLSGSATNQTSVLWTTSGDGTFDDDNLLGAIYTPGSNDIIAETVILTLTAYSVSPCTGSDADQMVLSIQHSPTVDAGADSLICENNTLTLNGYAENNASILWSTSGNGTFDNAVSLTATYAPGSADIVSGIATLTLTAYAISPCNSDAVDDLILTIQQLPDIDAGVNDTIHEDSTFSAAGTASNYQSILWTSSGDGTFDNASVLNAIYTPGVSDIATGTAILYLAANSIVPCSSNVIDSLTLYVQSTQEIDLVTGWNNISFSKMPNDFNMISILQDLIDANSLTKVISETGGFVQYIPGLGWLNTIGDMANTEGYYIKATENTQLVIIGLPVQLPFEIPLQTGWNIMGYPTNTPEDAQVVFQDLIDEGSFIKAIDEAGGFIQFIPGLGWLNTIGNLSVGEGYYIKVSSNDTLTLGGTTQAWQCGDTIVDPRDGQVYNTVLIGDRCWMAENLNIGTRIDGANNQTDNSIIEKYCYDDDVANCDIYGGLYQWDEMMEYVASGDGVQGICPDGWHLPTDDAWKTMEMALGMSQSQVDNTGWRGTDEGGKMKETGTIHWNSPNTGATNSSGFSALPGGFRDSYGTFGYHGNWGYWWVSSEFSDLDGWERELSCYYDQVSRNYFYKTQGISVRCLKN